MINQKKIIPAASKNQLGVTLIELMVAITISLILLAGVGQIYLSNKQTYRVTENMSRLQENARFAMDFISTSIRESDHWGCVGKIKSEQLSDIIDINNDDSDNNSSYSSGDKINYSAGLSSYSNIDADGDLVTTDTLRLITATQEGISVISSSGSTINVENISEFKKDDIILINNCTHAQVTTISGDPSGSILPVSSVINHDYVKGATVHKVNISTYSIGKKTPAGSALIPGLYLDDGNNNSELVEGIEDMQLQFGADDDGDRIPDYYVDAGTAVLNMNDVVSVKVTLVARTIDDNTALNTRVYDIDGIDGNADDVSSDKRITKVYTSTIALRNRLN